MQILKSDIVNLVPMRFIGIRYDDSNRDENSSFDYLWQEWLDNDKFTKLAKAGNIMLDKAKIGFTYTTDDNSYWIGYFFEKDTYIPSGYDFFDLFVSTCAYASLQGQADEQEMFGIQGIESCVDQFIKDDIFDKYKIAQDWFFEAYDDKFTLNDKEVKIDYYFNLRKATVEDKIFYNEAKQAFGNKEC